MSHWYAIRPSDTFLIRDGRNFVTGDGSKYESTLPNQYGRWHYGSCYRWSIWLPPGSLSRESSCQRKVDPLSHASTLYLFPLRWAIQTITIVPQQASPLNVATSSFVGAKLTTSPRNGHWEYNESLIPLNALSKFLPGSPRRSYPRGGKDTR